jgi:hypothetical protein
MRLLAIDGLLEYKPFDGLLEYKALALCGLKKLKLCIPTDKTKLTKYHHIVSYHTKLLFLLDKKYFSLFRRFKRIFRHILKSLINQSVKKFNHQVSFIIV